VVPLARADLLAILIRIAGEGHSRAVQAPVVDEVLGEPSLHLVHDLRQREELVRPLLDVASDMRFARLSAFSNVTSFGITYS